MTKAIKKELIQLCTATALLIGLLTVSASAVDTLDLRCVIDPENGSISTIYLQDGRMYLPAAADFEKLCFEFSGNDVTLLSSDSGIVALKSGRAVDIRSLWSQEDISNGYCTLSLQRNGTETEFTMYRTENLASLYISSADMEKDRVWLEEDKGNQAKGNEILLLDQNGAVIYEGTTKNMKGRGNSTWGYPKKPYQIKLTEAVDLIQTGDPAEKEKTWVLLANYCDPTMSHNAFTYQLGQQIGLSYTPNSRFVDLYYDGEYRGLYQLCEKTEVGAGRVAIHDLESDVLEASGRKNADGLDSVPGKTEQGLDCHYVEGLTLPEDVSGGYLLEMDYEMRAKEEASWFKTNHGHCIVCKSPESLPLEGISYISALYQQFEDAVYNGGTHPETWEDYSRYVDVVSLAKCYCILELSQDCDAFLSSTYFYKPEGEDKLYAGPLWDFDSGYGSSDRPLDIRALLAGNTALGRMLLQIPSFREAVAEEYGEISKWITDTALAEDFEKRESSLQSIDYDAALISGSRRMDATLWPESLDEGTFWDAIRSFQDFLMERNNYLTDLISEGDSWGKGPYIDVSENDWYWDAVSHCHEHGLLKGVSDTHFDPYGSVTRGMLASVLYRMAGTPDVSSVEIPFEDVPDGEWYADAVRWAYQNGIVGGMDDTHFCPKAPILRQDLAVMLWRNAGGSLAEALADDASAPTTADCTEVSTYAKEAVEWAVASGLFKEDPEQGLMPLEFTTRVQLAVVLQRLSD